MKSFKDNDKVYNVYTGKEIKNPRVSTYTTFHKDGTTSMQIANFSRHSDGSFTYKIGNSLITNGKSVYIRK